MHNHIYLHVCVKITTCHTDPGIYIHTSRTHIFWYIVRCQLKQTPSKFRRTLKRNTHSHTHTRTNWILRTRRQTDRLTDKATWHWTDLSYTMWPPFGVLKAGHIVYDSPVPYYVASSQISERGHIVQDRSVRYYVASSENSEARPHSMGQLCPVYVASFRNFRNKATQCGTDQSHTMWLWPKKPGCTQ